MPEKPNPGSAEAVDLGCTCPIIDNHYGKGILLNGNLCHYVNGDCPMHGDPQWAEILAKGDLSRFYEEDDTLPHSEDDA